MIFKTFRQKKISLVILILSFLTSNISYAKQDKCLLLTGEWEGTYREETAIFPHSGPWPIKFSIIYDSKTHLLFGLANTPLVPSSVSAEGTINYVSQEKAQIIGSCENNKITQLLLSVGQPKCGHYTKPGGKVLFKNSSILHLTYETAMRDIVFTSLLHKVSENPSVSLQKQILPKMPQIESCH